MAQLMKRSAFALLIGAVSVACGEAPQEFDDESIYTEDDTASVEQAIEATDTVGSLNAQFLGCNGKNAHLRLYKGKDKFKNAERGKNIFAIMNVWQAGTNNQLTPSRWEERDCHWNLAGRKSCDPFSYDIWVEGIGAMDVTMIQTEAGSSWDLNPYSQAIITQEIQVDLDCRPKIITFSNAGPQPDKNCTLMNEPSDPHTWSDNYLCTERTGLQWSYAGPIDGMKCTAIYEASDPHTWNDNYLCVPQSWPETITFHSAGKPAGKNCTQLYEPSDPDTWHDNFICW